MHRVTDTGGQRPASMRPRVFPAEDGGDDREPVARHGRASMRPRVFPAEDVDHDVVDGVTSRRQLQ